MHFILAKNAIFEHLCTLVRNFWLFFEGFYSFFRILEPAPSKSLVRERNPL